MVNKISIVGVGGVGATLAFTILNRLPVNELALIDIDADLAKGSGLDLEDCRGSFGFSTKIKGSNRLSDIKNSDIVVITAGLARKKGMTRLDLLKINSKIAKEISEKIKKLAKNAIVIAVTNPLDFITYIVAKETGFPRNRVIGMGSSLDTSRLFNILHNSTGASTLSMQGFAYGPHSKDMIVESKRITIATKSLESVVGKSKAKTIEERVQLRGAEIVSVLKKSSARFGPAAACSRLIETIVYNKNELIPVSAMLKGEYGLNNICLGVPCFINRKGIAKIIEVELTKKEKTALKKAEKLFKECMI
ncbi:MAG: malate dehydrogenase [Candidatus Omnitrophica bacterium]|nr:malate dehydrogenase [Candidatus Omnitrophota bacterium]